MLRFDSIYIISMIGGLTWKISIAKKNEWRDIYPPPIF